MILCVRIPHFALAVVREDTPDTTAGPAVLLDKLERGTVLDATAEARRLGVRIGMSRAQASACATGAEIFVDDVTRRGTRWEAVLDALDAVSPIVEDAESGRAYLNMRGVPGDPARHFRSTHGALATLAVPEARLGYATTPFAAYAAGCTGNDVVCTPGREAALVAPLPLDILGLDPNVLERLRLLGIATLGELRKLPVGPLARRFGPAARSWHERAHGREDRPLVARSRKAAIERARYGEGGASSKEQVFFALHTLVEDLAGDLVQAGKSCGALALAIECEDGGVHEVTAVSAQPTGDPTQLRALLRAQLEDVSLTAAVVGLRIRAERLEEAGSPTGLFAQDDPDPGAVDLALARIASTLGTGRTHHARLVQAHRLERRFSYEIFSYDGLPRRDHTSLHDKSAEQISTIHFRHVAPRALQIRCADGIPQALESPSRRIEQYAGPWRRDETWFRARIARDEFDVQLDDGALWRIARDEGGWSLLGVYE